MRYGDEESLERTEDSDARSHGSWSFDDPERPKWTFETKLVHSYDYHHEDSIYAYSVLKGERPDGQKVFLRGRRVQGTDDWQLAKQEDELYRLSGLETYRKGTGDEPDVLYHLPELIADMAARPDDTVFICEGEKDVETLRALGQIATTNPNGALNWKDEFSERFRGRKVVILVDNDNNGRQRAARILASLRRVACL